MGNNLLRNRRRCRSLMVLRLHCALNFYFLSLVKCLFASSRISISPLRCRHTSTPLFEGFLWFRGPGTRPFQTLRKLFSTPLTFFAEHLFYPIQVYLPFADVSRATISNPLYWTRRNPQDQQPTSTLLFHPPQAVGIAIVEDLGLEIKIVVDNSPLQEYEDKEVDAPDDGFSDDIRKFRRYVEVNVDTEFGVQICTTPNNEYLDDNKKKRLIVSIDLDGQKDLQVTLVGSLKRSDLVEGKSEHNGQTSVLRKFRFKTVSTGI